MKKTKNILASLLIIACMTLLIICTYKLIENTVEYEKNNDLINQLIDDVVEVEVNEENTDEDTLSIDWKKLKEINEDIIGWIKIKDTNINYPILKDKNLYYLKHSYNKEYNSNGSIFTMNSKPFEENKTIIYGHNMRNGIMFSELGRYLEEQFLYSHLEFEIYTPEGKFLATIFSCYSIDVNIEKNNIKNLDFDEEIKYYKNASKYSITNVDNIKKIIKLSTCSYLNNRSVPTEKRYYIVAKIEKM